MTPADKRMMELLDRWLTSLELHLKYADLPDADYFAVQPWPKHDRPTRWILELARQKTQELRGHQESRVAMGDSKFAESLELMGFLSNLVGSQHVQRFIPLAEPEKEQELPRPSAKSHPVASSKGNGHAKPAVAASDELDATREMPRVAAPPAAPTKRPPEPPPPPRPAAVPKPAAKAAKKAPAVPALVGKTSTSSAAVQKKVMADAVRLLKWGKEWHELVDLIARIADRPPAAEIRRILRSHKAEIEMQAEGDE
ncbi:MAG: hypothetical protein RLZZ403_1326 [Pseudomonadota bacterium]